MRRTLLIAALALLLLVAVCPLVIEEAGRDGAPPEETGDAGRPAAPTDGEEEAADEAAPSGTGEEERETLAATVLSPEGDPLPGVGISYRCSRDGASHYRHHLGGDDAVSDERGRVEMAVAPRAQYVTLEIRPPPGYAPPPPLEVQSGGELFYEVPGEIPNTQVPATGIWRGWLGLGARRSWPLLALTLERADDIEGRVVGADGRTLGDVRVTATWPARPAGNRRLEVRTGSSGRFVLPVSAGAEGVMVKAEAGADAGLAPFTAAGVRPGTKGLTLRLLPAAPFEVRPTDPEGNRLASGLLRLTPLGMPGAAPFERECYGHWDSELRPALLPGTWEVEFLPRDLRYLPAGTRVTVPGPPVDLRCAAAGAIEGVVRGEDVGGFAVTFTGASNLNPMSYWRRSGIASEEVPGSPTWTEKDGRFRIRGVGSTPGDLYVRRPGDARCAYLTDLRPADGTVEVALAAGLSIRGRVEGIEPWERRGVFLRASRGRLTQQAGLEKDGTFDLAGLPPGEFTVEAWGMGLLVHSRLAFVHEVRAGAEGVVLTVRR